MIAILDLNIGNIVAIKNMYKKIGVDTKITINPLDIKKCTKIILPGNGSFDSCLGNLRSSGLLPIIEQRVLCESLPFLGICIGAQILGFSSEEGNELGLGWINMNVKRFPLRSKFKVPNLGWHQLSSSKTLHPLVSGMNHNTRFYFMHSYYMILSNTDEILFSSNYGLDFAAGFVKKNIVGVQFHPEKSHRYGKEFLSAFAKWEYA